MRRLIRLQISLFSSFHFLSKIIHHYCLSDLIFLVPLHLSFEMRIDRSRSLLIIDSNVFFWRQRWCHRSYPSSCSTAESSSVSTSQVTLPAIHFPVIWMVTESGRLADMIGSNSCHSKPPICTQSHMDCGMIWQWKWPRSLESHQSARLPAFRKGRWSKTSFSDIQH